MPVPLPDLMKRLFAAAFFTSFLHLLPAQAQPGKPGTTPAAKSPATAAPDGRLVMPYPQVLPITVDGAGTPPPAHGA